jgi:hypothetical protein
MSMGIENIREQLHFVLVSTIWNGLRHGVKHRRRFNGDVLNTVLDSRNLTKLDDVLGCQLAGSINPSQRC